MYMNLLGKTVRDPILSKDKKGRKFSAFTLECDKSNNIKGDATYINCYVFDNKANIIKEKCKEGQNIEIEGFVKFKLHTTTDDKKLNLGYMLLDKVDLIDNNKREAILC